MTEEPLQQPPANFQERFTRAFEPFFENNRNANLFIIFFLLLAAIPIIGVGVATTRTILPIRPAQNPIVVPGATTATFTCAGNSSVEAVFYTDRVRLWLSDGRSLELPQVLSASGARYANADESFVFWNKGNTAFITEGKDTTYSDCNQTPFK